jgi:GT2 family glycosyltransferase
VQQDSGYLGVWEVDRECVAVTGACLLVSMRAFDEVGGFTLSLPSNWQDVDFCFKLRAAGYRNVWTPQAALTHFESITRNADVMDAERMKISSRWARELVSDPYLSPADKPLGPTWPKEWYR